jgi:hypothetical protein
MLTNDPKKMLKNLWESAEDGCLLGLTIWGDKAKNNFFGHFYDFSAKHGLIPTGGRTNFYLYPLIEDLVNECGWDKVIGWEQNGMFPCIEFS